MKMFNEIIKKSDQLKELQKELERTNYDKLKGLKVRITRKYSKWLKEEFEEDEEINYEYKRPLGKIIYGKYDREDGVTVTVEYPNGLKSHYSLKNIEICNKNLFLKECK